jgi:hypothetical protein
VVNSSGNSSGSNNALGESIHFRSAITTRTVKS